jgi:hypothetical protein
MVTHRNIENMFNRKKYDLITGILILSLMVVSLIIIAEPAHAYERPEYTDGLTGNWHPGGFCIPCHYTLLGNERAKEISTKCTQTCHARANIPKDSKNAYKVNMVKISEIHRDILCIRCHIGTKSALNVTAVDFHRVMSKTDCMSCHTFENDSYVKPQKTDCSDCHGGDPHVVHGKRLDNMCEACHGEFALKYIDKLKLPSNASNATLLSSMNKTETIKGYPTIGEIISRIIESILR